MPLRPVERRQQLIEIPRAGIEIDFLPQSLDQQVELVGTLRSKCIGIGFDILDLPSRGHARKNLSDKPAGLLAVKIGAFTAAERIEQVVELTLEPIDGLRVEPCEAFQADQLIKPVLAFDQKVQAPLAVFDVEGQKV